MYIVNWFFIFKLVSMGLQLTTKAASVHMIRPVMLSWGSDNTHSTCTCMNQM